MTGIDHRKVTEETLQAVLDRTPGTYPCFHNGKESGYVEIKGGNLTLYYKSGVIAAWCPDYEVNRTATAYSPELDRMYIASVSITRYYQPCGHITRVRLFLDKEDA